MSIPFQNTCLRALDPIGICIKQSIWLKLLGNPFDVSLGDPFGSVQMSASEAIQKALAGQLTIAKFYYLLNGVDSFSFEHQHPTFASQAPTNGCFHYLYVVTKF